MLKLHLNTTQRAHIWHGLERSQLLNLADGLERSQSNEYTM